MKNLKKVKRVGYVLRRVPIADDTPAKIRRHSGSAVHAPQSSGSLKDGTLPRPARDLASLGGAADVRALEERGWWREIPG